MGYQDYLWGVLVLMLVLGLIAVSAWAVRRFNLIPGAVNLGRSTRRLVIVEVAPVDVKSKLVLVRRDETEHLLLIGVQSALLVEGNIQSGRRAPPAAARLRGDGP